MVCAARLRWLTAELQRGRAATLRMSSSAGALRVHYHLCQADDARRANNALMIEFTSQLEALASQYVVNDHGHQNSKGESLVSLVFKSASTPAPQRTRAAPVVTELPAVEGSEAILDTDKPKVSFNEDPELIQVQSCGDIQEEALSDAGSSAEGHSAFAKLTNEDADYLDACYAQYRSAASVRTSRGPFDFSYVIDLKAREVVLRIQCVCMSAHSFMSELAGQRLQKHLDRHGSRLSSIELCAIFDYEHIPG